MTEIGTGEMEISPIKSLQEQVKRKVRKVRSAIAVTGMTAKTRLSTAKEEQLERTLDERFERGEMFRIFKKIRRKRTVAATDEEKTIWSQRLHAALGISRDLTNKLDILNRQYYDSGYSQFVGVEVLGEHAEIPVRHYSLRDKENTLEGEVLTPIVIIGGATSGPTVTKSTAEAFALQYPNRDVYVIGYPDSNQSRISVELPKKLKKHGNLVTYTRINKDVLLKMGFEKFDLVGISMGGGIVLQAATDREFAGRINNLIAISPTSIQKTKGKIEFGLDFLREVSYSRMHPRQWLRVPQAQPGYKLGSNKNMGFSVSGEISRPKSLSADDLSKLHVQGRVIVATGEKDVLISCEQIKKETGAANEKRTATGERPIEFVEAQGCHHSLGDAYAAGIVALIRNTYVLPNQVNVKDLPTSTAEVFVREDPRLASVADQIIGGYP